MLSRHPEAAVAYLRPDGVWRTLPEPPSAWDYGSWLTAVRVWGYSFSTRAGQRDLWRVHVEPGSLAVTCTAPLTVKVPYDDGLPVPASVTVNGVVRRLRPVDGHVVISFPAGRSTATFAP